jgi:hypothetical protein
MITILAVAPPIVSLRIIGRHRASAVTASCRLPEQPQTEPWRARPPDNRSLEQDIRNRSTALQYDRLFDAGSGCLNLLFCEVQVKRRQKTDRNIHVGSQPPERGPLWRSLGHSPVRRKLLGLSGPVQTGGVGQGCSHWLNWKRGEQGPLRVMTKPAGIPLVCRVAAKSWCGSLGLLTATLLTLKRTWTLTRSASILHPILAMQSVHVHLTILLASTSLACRTL